jgi:hypothetical protein
VINGKKSLYRAKFMNMPENDRANWPAHCKNCANVGLRTLVNAGDSAKECGTGSFVKARIQTQTPPRGRALNRPENWP